jgi:hypothetical protein
LFSLPHAGLYRSLHEKGGEIIMPPYTEQNGKIQKPVDLRQLRPGETFGEIDQGFPGMEGQSDRFIFNSDQPPALANLRRIEISELDVPPMPTEK